MRIFRLTTFLDYGGIESKMVNLSTHSDGNEWRFCSIGKGGNAKRKIKKNNKIAKSFNLPHKIPSFMTIVKLCLYFRKHKPDVVHSSGAEANFHGTIAAKLAGIKIIISEEIGIPGHSKRAVFFFNLVYRMSNYVLGESQTVINYLKANYSVNPNKLKVVPNFTLFSDLGDFNKKDSGTFTIVSVSRLEPIKNIEGIVKAVHLVKQDGFNIKYVIVGEGNSRVPIQNLIKGLGLHNEVQLVGFQSEPKAFLREADLFVLNSFSEGFSNSLLEAMYCKTPSISTDVGAASEMIAEGITGWITSPGNDFELYGKIKAVIGLDKSEKDKIGLNAHNSVKEKYSLESHVNNLLKLYQS